MRILIDRHIPYAARALSAVAEVIELEPEQITASTVRHADALVIRTRTHCSEALLDGSNVRFIATATIGFDHIDTDYCARHQIGWTNAPGCNAQAVCDYVEAALKACARQRRRDLTGLTVGIVGVGHVGSLVASMCGRMGLNTMLCDPPRQLAEDRPERFRPLDDLLERADILTVHTPLTWSGPHQTAGLLSADRIIRSRASLIINAARGGIVDEAALVSSGKDAVIDCWQGEPRISIDTLRHALIATPHIAGYSLQGKANASTACVRAVSRAFGLGLDDWNAPAAPPSAPYDIMADDAALRAHPEQFECLRSTYRLR